MDSRGKLTLFNNCAIIQGKSFNEIIGISLSLLSILYFSKFSPNSFVYVNKKASFPG